MAIRPGQRGRQNSASDIVRYVKHNYVPPPASVPDRSKVTARTEFVYKSVPLEGSRPSKHSRHTTCRTTGHFGIPWRPYQPLGDICLDPNSLFCQVLGIELPVPHEPHDPHAIHFESDYRQNQREFSAGEKGGQLPQDGKEGSSREDDGKIVQFCKDRAGLTFIRNQLKEISNQKMALEAGQDYRVYINRCADRTTAKEKEKTAGEMVIQPLSSHHFNRGQNRKYTLAYDPETMTMQVKAKGGEQSASHGSQTIKEHLQHLDAINIILTSLLNMKSRHLRTKNPLSNEVVQGLRKVPEVHNIGLKHTTLERASATNQKLKPSNVPTSLISIDQDSTGRSNYALGPSSVQNSVKSQDNYHIRHSRRPVHAGRKGSSKKVDTSHRLDTWEDLVSDGKSKARHRRPWHVPFDHRTSNVLMRTHHPRDIKKTKTWTAMTMVRDQMLDMMKIQKAAAKQTQDRIDKHIRDRNVMRELTLQELSQLHPLWNEKCRKVDKILVNHALQSQQDQGVGGRQTVEWLEKLRRQGAEQNLINLEAYLKLEALNRFAADEFSNLVFAKEKLCLLTISLPINEICEPAFQNAIKFILGDILGLSADLLRQWLAYRHISQPDV